MAAATLDEVESALFARLETLKKSAATPGPFVLVDRWAGQVTAQGGVDSTTAGKAPSALFVYEGSSTEGEGGARAETILDEAETVERHVFRVYVTVQDTRGDGRALKGTTGQTGALACLHAVKLALTGLRVANTLDPVRLLGSQPWVLDRGTQYTYVARFVVRAQLDTAATEAAGEPASEPFETMTGENGPEGATDLAPSTIDLTDT